MQHALKLAPVILALVLAACGGGGSGSEAPAPVTPPPPEPVTPSPPEVVVPSYQATLIAGVATPAQYGATDQWSACIDGAALGARLSPRTNAQAFARAANGNLLLAEGGYCGSRYRIRAIDPVSNTIKTLAVGELGQYDYQGALTTFLTPIALAAAPSGDIYIGDSEVTPQLSFGGIDFPGTRTISNRGPGIWKLGLDGNVSLVAGVSLPKPLNAGPVDGVGATASFRYIGTMCYGADGLLYLKDSGLRTVSPDGVVTTVTSPDYQPYMATCGINGSVLLMRRWSSDPDGYDFYDPIAQKLITNKPPTGVLRTDLDSTGLLLYFGPDNPSVLIRESIPSSTSRMYSGLTLVNLVDGSSTRVAWFSTPDRPVDLAAVPPVIDSAIAVVPNGSTDFDILTNQGVIRFTRKP